MAVLVLGLILFFTPHLLRELGLRQRLKAVLPSAGAYMGLYSLTARAGLGINLWGKLRAPFPVVLHPIYEWLVAKPVVVVPGPVCVVACKAPPV